jgi:pimeloyl-ACP methyl ester carboxylesterase
MNRIYALIILTFLSGKAFGQCERVKDTYLDVDNTKVRYVEAGAGPAVVMIHGNAGSVDDWDFNSMTQLCHNYRLIAIDRPGHGKSDRPDGKAATLHYQTKVVHDTLAQLGVSHPVLVGHSWGGSLALAYAVDYPNELSAIVLLAPAAYPDGGGDQFMRALLKTPVIGDASLTVGRLILGKHILKKELNKAFYPDSVPEDYLRYASSSWLHHKQVRATLEDEWSLNEDLEKTAKHYPEIRIPVVIVTGDQDKVVSAKDNAYRLKTSIAQSQVVELKNTGHQIPQTHPESIYNAVSLTSKTSAGLRESIR